ncbi:uncharacterized protein DS421_5g154410 [Arachis hypogaea]|nr:uncharacterized protein DS421_5g154410 [Arachis hypogaea]
MGEAEERDPRGREDRARPAATHSRRSCCQRHPRQIRRCRSFWPCLCRRTTPLPLGTPIEVGICVVSAKLASTSLSIKLVFTVRVVAEIICVRMYDHMVTASFSVLRHHWSRPTDAEIPAALCSFIPSLHVVIEAVSAFGKASGAEALVAADFGLRETSSVDAFGLWFRVSR